MNNKNMLYGVLLATVTSVCYLKNKIKLELNIRSYKAYKSD